MDSGDVCGHDVCSNRGPVFNRGFCSTTRTSPVSCDSVVAVVTGILSGTLLVALSLAVLGLNRRLAPAGFAALIAVLGATGWIIWLHESESAWEWTYEMVGLALAAGFLMGTVYLLTATFILWWLKSCGWSLVTRS